MQARKRNDTVVVSTKKKRGKYNKNDKNINREILFVSLSIYKLENFIFVHITFFFFYFFFLLIYILILFVSIFISICTEIFLPVGVKIIVYSRGQQMACFKEIFLESDDLKPKCFIRLINKLIFMQYSVYYIYPY